jgi:hypothetical protein
MCVGIKPEEWVVMYIYVCRYQGLVPTHIYIHDYSLLWLGTHTHIYMTTHSSSLVPTHTYIHMTTHSSNPEEWVVMYICVCVYQARGVSSHVYMCVCGYQARGVSSHVYVCVGIKLATHSSGLIPTHIYTWLLTPMAWYRHTHIYIYTCVCGFQARGVSSHVHICVYIKPEEWVVMYICVWVSSQRSE